jgi:hypothetical protein
MAEPFDPANAQRPQDRVRLEALPPSEVASLLRLACAETVVDPGAGTGVYTVARPLRP